MADWKRLGKEGLDEAATEVGGWPWYAKLGVPIVGMVVIGGIALSAVTGMWDKATTIRTLNAQQMEIVKAEAARVASAFTEQVDGRTVPGQLLTCSNTDSDPKGSEGFGKVTCTARVPNVKVETKSDGGQVAAVVFVERNMDCGIPVNGTSGCKFKR